MNCHSLTAARSVAGLTIAAAFTAAVFATTGQHGRFLRSPERSSIVHEYGSDDPTEFDQPVTDTTKDIDAGEIKFDYDTFSQQPDGDEKGGGALAGGFFPNDGVKVKDGFQLHWVQTIIASTTGANDWNLPESDAGEFPDATPGDRAYPFRTVPVEVDPAPAPGYQDFPCRDFEAGDSESWLAELGLVCIANEANDDGFRQAKVVGSFLWGFGWDNAMEPFSVDTVDADSPSFWGPPTQSFLDTLNDFYDGMGGGGNGDPVESGKFAFESCDNCFQQNETTFCPGDTNDDGQTSVEDLINVITTWGTDGQGDGFDADTNNDGVVDVLDLVQGVIVNWGPCPVCGDPEAGECCAANGTPGCSTSSCCDLVCDIDAFCCDNTWDSICADQAADLPECGCVAVVTEACCFETGFCVALTNKECVKLGAIPLGPDSVCLGDQNKNGVDDACEPLTEACCFADGTCSDESPQACQDQGGFPFGPGSQCSQVICEPILCGPGAGPCDIPNGTPGCDDVACCRVICAMDPFCCDNTWDQICADQALQFCFAQVEACCLPDGFCVDLLPPDCQLEGGVPQGPGSNCDQVTCNTQTCGPGSGPCDLPNGTPGCDDLFCCQAVCAVDALCCDVIWDRSCVNQALAVCIR